MQNDQQLCASLHIVVKLGVSIASRSPNRKTSLKMASSRVKLLRNKKGIQLTQLKREVAQLLQTGQDQTARIRVEHVVREEKTITAYELIDLYCELIVARLPIIETQKNCPIDLKEAIASIIFASPRCSDIPELMDIRKHFTAKYGKEFVTAAIELRPDSGVNRSMIEKLSAVAPDGPTKVKILTGIAEEHKIKWEPDWFKDNVPEPPAYVPNAPNTDKISKMNVEPQTVQASPRFEPKPDIPSNIHHVAEPENSMFAHSSAGPSATLNETVKSNQSYSGEENSLFVERQKWNMEFKDASAAAHAAAESAEMASMAARAAAEIASRGKFTENASTDSNVVQDESFRVHSARTDHSLWENPSRMQHVRADPKRNVKASGMMDENNLKKEHHHAVKHDRPNSSQQSNSPMRAVQKDGIHQNTGSRSSSKFIPYADQKESLGRYDEVQYEEELKVQHDSSPEDSEFRRSTSSGRVASKSEYEIFTDSNHRHDDDFIEDPLYGETWETRNQPKSYQSKRSDLSESYDSSMPISDPPKFDDDLYEDPIDSNIQNILYKEDLETKEPFEKYDFYSTFSQDQKVDVLGQRKYSSDSHKHLFSEGGDYSVHGEKGSTTIDDAPRFDAPHFDDDGADEDDYIQSSGRKSPEYSSPDEERSPKKFGILSSKHLYQPELSESFKNSSIYSQLVKPIRLGDDSDGATSGSDEEVQKSKYHGRTSPEVVRPSYGRRGTSIISEELTVAQHSEESLEEDFNASITKNSGSGDLLTKQQSPGSTRSRSDAKSYDRSSFSRLLEEAERLSSPRRSSLQAVPDAVDDSQDNYQSNFESGVELNVESLSGGLKNKGLRLPPYTKGTSAFSSSSSISTIDDAPKVRESSTLSSDDEIKEILGKRESIRKKKISSLQGTYFDPKGDDSLEDADGKDSISISNLSEKRFVDSLDERSSPKVPQSYIDSEDVSSGEEGVKRTVPSKHHSSAGISRRTRASGQSRAQTETRSSYKTSSATESVSEKDTSSSTALGVESSAKPKTRSGIQVESLEPRRREENKTRPSHLSKMSSREENSSPSVAGKRATSSQTEARSSHRTSSATDSVSGKSTSSSTSFAAETSARPKTKSVIQMESLEPRRREINKTKPSRLVEESSSPSVAVKQETGKTLLRENSDKKASHVHPNLPSDWDDFASRFQRKNHQ
ncbi:hypothetical protein V2J09_012322 [Rumex salicifolius]